VNEIGTRERRREPYQFSSGSRQTPASNANRHSTVTTGSWLTQKVGRDCRLQGCDVTVVPEALLPRLLDFKGLINKFLKKTLLRWLEFFLLRRPLDGARSVLSARARCSVAGHYGPAIWGFSPSGFSLPVRNEACWFRNQQSGGGQLATIVLFRTGGAMAFSGFPRGRRLA
jgi:hypothetical protein